MAIRTFNSVGGYSVGEVPDTIIYSNGDIITANAVLTTNLDVGTLLAGNGNITVGNAIVAGNVLTDHLLHANGVAWDFNLASGDAGWIQYKGTGTDLTASGNLVYIDAATLTGTSILTIGNTTSNAQVFIGTSSSNTVINNGNINATGHVNTSGYGTFANVYARNINNDHYIVLTDGDGQLIEDETFSYINGVLAASNANIGNSTNYVNISNGNVTTTGNILVGTGSSNVSITNDGNINATGTITASSITYTGNVKAPGSDTQVVFNDAGNVNANSGLTFAKLSNTLTVGGNIVSNGNIVTTGSGGNITMTGGNITGANNISANSLTLTNDAIISGNLFVAGSTTYVNTTTMAVEDPIIQLGGGANNATLTTNDSIDRGLLMHYYTTHAVDAFMGWDNSGSQFIVASNVTYNSTGQTVTVNTYGNIVAGNANLGNLTTSNYFHGVFDSTSNIQSNIDTLGTLTGLSSTGTVNFAAASNVTLGPIANVHITGGNDGQIIATDGTGNLYWTSSPQVTEIQHGTSNVSIPTADGNINLSSGGTANVVVVTSTGANVAGTLNVTGNTTIGTNGTGNLIIGYTTVQSATVTTTATTAGQVIASVDVNGTSIRGIEFFIKGENTTDSKYKIATVSAVHDGSAVEYTETTVATTNGSPGTFGVTMSGTVISLVVTPQSSHSTVWTTQYRTI